VRQPESRLNLRRNTVVWGQTPHRSGGVRRARVHSGRRLERGGLGRTETSGVGSPPEGAWDRLWHGGGVTVSRVGPARWGAGIWFKAEGGKGEERGYAKRERGVGGE